MLFFVYITFLFGSILAEEWSTISGEHCIDRCSFKGDGNEFYWCHVTDLSQSHLTSAVKRGGKIDERFKWDYCVPTSELDEDSITAYTALHPKTKCVSPCKRSSFGPRNVCYTEETDNPDVERDPELGFYFYCSEQIPVLREQLSSQHGFWCVDSCRKEHKDHFWCNTLAGPDYCSPKEGLTHKNEECTSPCEQHTNEETGKSFNACYTSSDNSTWGYCGVHNAPIKQVQFTVDDQICADICREEKEFQVCNFVEWTFNETSNVAAITKGQNYCEGSKIPSERTWYIILITAISIAVIVAIVIGACIWRQKRGFQPVPSVGP